MNNEKIGKYLATKRKEKGITQKELADEMGVTFQAVSRWEKGDSIPDLDSLDHLADFYEVTIDEILQRNVIKDNSFEENLHIVIFMIVNIAYIIGTVCFYGILTSFNVDFLAYLCYIMFAIAGLFLQNMYYIISEKNKQNLRWYLLAYIPFAISFLFFFLIDSGIID